MTVPLTLVVVSAGTGQPSSTRLLADRLARATDHLLEQDGRPVTTTHIELRDLVTEIGHQLVTGFPGPALRQAQETVGRADGLIAVTPVYTASYSGLFKSFFDVLDPTALTGTPVLVAATGGTARHSLALDHALRPLFTYLRAMVVPTAVYAASEDWGGSGDRRTDGLSVRIERAASELAGLLGRLPAPAGGGALATAQAGGVDVTGAGDAPGDLPPRTDAGPDPDRQDDTGREDDAGREDALDREDDVVPFAEQLAAVRRGTL